MIFGYKNKVRWTRKSGEFARREDVKIRFIKKGIIVEYGTKALFLRGGKFVGVLSPDEYDAGGISNRMEEWGLSNSATVVLVDAGEVSLDLNIGELLTGDSRWVGAKVSITVQLDSPEKFFVKLMKGAELMEINDLRESLEDEIKNILEAKINNYPVDELYGNLELKKGLEQDFEHLMRTTFEESGLKLKRLTWIDYEFNDETIKLLYLRGKAVTEGEVIGLKKEIRELEKKLEISEIENKAEIEKTKREKEHELKMLELKQKSEIEAKSREVSVGTTLPPLLNDAKSSETKVERRIEALSDRIERRRRGRNCHE